MWDLSAGRKGTEIQTRKQGIFIFYIACIFLFKSKYLSLTPCLRTNKVIAPCGCADFLIWVCCYNGCQIKKNNKKRQRIGQRWDVKCCGEHGNPVSAQNLYRENHPWQRQLNRLVKSGTIKTTIWVLSKHGSGALRNDSCIICLQIILRATSGTGWKQFRKSFYTEGLLGAEMYRGNWNERINNSINNLPTTAIRHDMKITWKSSSTVYFIPIRKIWGMRGESKQGN